MRTDLQKKELRISLFLKSQPRIYYRKKVVEYKEFFYVLTTFSTESSDTYIR